MRAQSITSKIMNVNEKFMKSALREAKKAEKAEEVPIGCVIVADGKIIARAYNMRQTKRLATAHAEILAIEKACRKIKDWRLDGMEMYVTLEPCAMCAGAIANSRIKKVWFGAYEQKGRSLTAELADANLLNHKTEVIGGVLQEECTAMLTGFFTALRQKQKEEKERKKAAAQDEGKEI